jgi:hypothetical protein
MQPVGQRAMGFGPLALLGGLSFLPGLLSKLFGGDPREKLRKQIEALNNPQNIGKLTQQYYQQALGSPAYSQAQGTIAAGANQAGNQLAQSLGARGIGTTGTGAVLSSLLPSLVGSQTAGLRTGAYQSGQQMAMDQIQRQIAMLMGTQGPSQSSQLFAGGMNAFGPLLASYLQGKYPGSFPRTQ